MHTHVIKTHLHVCTRTHTHTCTWATRPATLACSWVSIHAENSPAAAFTNENSSFLRKIVTAPAPTARSPGPAALLCSLRSTYTYVYMHARTHMHVDKYTFVCLHVPPPLDLDALQRFQKLPPQRLGSRQAPSLLPALTPPPPASRVIAQLPDRTSAD